MNSMRMLTMMAGVAMIFLMACESSTKKETPNGFAYNLAKEGDGKVAGPNDFVVFNFKATDSKDSIWANSFDRGYPEFARVADSSRIADEDGITQMLRMLSKGDSAYFELSVKELFEEMGGSRIPPGIDSTLTLHYELSVKDIVAAADFPAYQQQVEQDYNAWIEKNSVAQLGEDTVKIDAYLSEKNLEARSLPSGIRYVITEEGKGPKATSGQSVKVHYAGYRLDGTYFDTSKKEVAQEQGLYDEMRETRNGYEPYSVVIDETSVIEGWHQALKEMNEGAKATFFIPSTLAYGPQARGAAIPANSILVFDLEMIDIE